MPQVALTIFIVLFIIVALLKFFFLLLNIHNLKKEGHKIPEEFASVIDESELKKANSYSIDSMHFSMFRTLFDKILMLVFLLSGIFVWYAGLFKGMNLIAAGLLFFAGLFIASTVIDLPFSYYSKFVLDEKYGFNRSTIKTWIGDVFKEIILSLILSGLLMLGVFLLIVYVPRFWWLLGWLLSLGFSIFTIFIYPLIIVPMFNKLTPLEGPLAERIRKVASQAGINVKNISEMDASKRSTKANAYFAGWGKSKRIVLFDTLVKSNTEDEIIAVLGHEMGHWKHKHIVKIIALSQLILFAGFLIAYFLIKSSFIYEMFEINGTPFFAGLLIVFVLLEIPSFFLSPLSAAFSRKCEREADSFAIKLTGDKETLISSLKKLVKKNLSNLFPHKFYVWFNYSHPPIIERLETIKKM